MSTTPNDERGTATVCPACGEHHAEPWCIYHRWMAHIPGAWRCKACNTPRDESSDDAPCPMAGSALLAGRPMAVEVERDAWHVVANRAFGRSVGYIVPPSHAERVWARVAEIEASLSGRST